MAVYDQTQDDEMDNTIDFSRVLDFYHEID